MDMQREDYLALCKLPKMTFDVDLRYYKGPVQIYRGMGSANVQRIIHDWFPAGSVVILSGTSYVSKGAVNGEFGYRRPELQLLDPKDLSLHAFNVVEALGLAEIMNGEKL